MSKTGNTERTEKITRVQMFIGYVVPVILILIGLYILSEMNTRDYTDLAPIKYPDIASELIEEVPVMWTTPHKLSLKRKTKER